MCACVGSLFVACVYLDIKALIKCYWFAQENLSLAAKDLVFVCVSMQISCL